ncbi:hypothetical protein [Bradyrhizobium sp. AZCC 2289]|uniref:hypothetical protein n=1 Tax=Bradyrhizobium sp. AZCC 2289 TaxID=3117026 RepID=UPI002FEF319F
MLRYTEQAKPHWQSAAEAVLMAAEDRGPLLHARVGMLSEGTEPRKEDPAIKQPQKRAEAYKILK